MKKRIISTLKIYLITALYLFIVAFVYSFYISKTNKNENLIVEVILGSTAFLLLGTLYGNYVHKKGLILGILIGIIHILLIKFIYFLAIGDFNLSILPTIIYTITCGIGGILGVNIKKII
ncbi:MAG: TIGR04086 family membrane protein [Anaeroplasma sp.]